MNNVGTTAWIRHELPGEPGIQQSGGQYLHKSHRREDAKKKLKGVSKAYLVICDIQLEASVLSERSGFAMNVEHRLR